MNSIALATAALVVLTFTGQVQAKKLVRESSNSHSFEADSDEQYRRPTKEAESGMELRKLRRAAVGAQAAGALGFGGALIEINFNSTWGLTAGFGGGEGFQAYEIQSKYVLAGDWLMPYMSFGFAHWKSIGHTGHISKTNPAILGEKLLNEDEKAAGEYAKNLLYPGIGLQYLQLKGDWAGSSVYAEITILLDVGNFVAAPTGSLGFLYYF